MVTPSRVFDQKNLTLDNSYKIPVKVLPSNFKGYPKFLKEINFSPFTYGEIKKLSQPSISVEQEHNILINGINLVLEGEGDSFTSKDLYYFDFQYINLLRKLNSDPNIMTWVLDVICPHCKEKQEITFTQDDIEFKELKEVDIPFKVECNKEVSLDFYPLTLGNYLFLKSGDERILEDYEISLIACMVRNYSFEDAFYLISQTTSPILHNIFNKVDIRLDFGLENLIRTCKNCEGKLEIRVNVDFPFFRAQS